MSTGMLKGSVLALTNKTGAADDPVDPTDPRGLNEGDDDTGATGEDAVVNVHQRRRRPVEPGMSVQCAR